MTLPTSGSISLADLRSEFGGTNPVSISEYYRGGTYVKNITVNSLVPASGVISLSNFRGSRYAAPFSVQYLGSAAGSTVSYFTPTINDPRCNLLVIQQRGSGSTGLLPGATAIIGGTVGQQLAAYRSTAYDDGAAITITSKLVPDASTQSISCPNADGTVFVFQFVGVESIAAAEITRDAVFNTDGGDRPISRRYVEVQAVAGRDCVLFASINKTSFSGEPTGKLDVYAGSGIGFGFDTNPVTGLNRYEWASLTPRLMTAFTLRKEMP